MKAGAPSSLRAESVSPSDDITYQRIHDAALQGDPLCKTSIQQAGECIGKALATSATILNPELIVVGSPLFPISGLLIDPIYQQIMNHTLPHISSSLRVSVSGLDWTKAVFIGSLVMISEKHWSPEELTYRKEKLATTI